MQMEILVSSGWLADNVNTAIILDASAHMPAAGRNAEQEYLNGHIQGARFLDLPSLKDGESPVPSALPTAAQFAARLSELGIAADDRVILYDGSKLRSSARAFLIFKMHGFANVAILDGGLEKWIAEQRPLETGRSAFAPTQIEPQTSDWSGIRTKQQILEICALQNKDLQNPRAEQIVDARDSDRFTGRTDDAVHGLAGGHIPSARNLPYTRLLAPDGTFKNKDELQAEFAEAGIDINRPIIASCGSGMTASVVLFALNLLGRGGALYDGSWSEWGADPETPKETGEAHPL